MQRGQILDAAKELTHGDRNENYGDPLTNHTRIAKLWSIWLEVEITPAQVAMCMALVKVARLIQSPSHEDSPIDLAAYAAIYSEIV